MVSSMPKLSVLHGSDSILSFWAPLAYCASFLRKGMPQAGIMELHFVQVWAVDSAIPRAERLIQASFVSRACISPCIRHLLHIDHSRLSKAVLRGRTPAPHTLPMLPAAIPSAMPTNHPIGAPGTYHAVPADHLSTHAHTRVAAAAAARLESSQAASGNLLASPPRQPVAQPATPSTADLLRAAHSGSQRSQVSMIAPLLNRFQHSKATRQGGNTGDS